MISFRITILKFGEQGEKTGWTYIEIPIDITQKLKPNNKQSFRVKGYLDAHRISGVALLPMGGGGFIMPVNAGMRRAVRKSKGAVVTVKLELDSQPPKINKDFLECLNDEPAALSYFTTLPKGHQNYFSKWIESAKTEPTKTKRMAMAISALSRRFGFPEMLREDKANRHFLSG